MAKAKSYHKRRKSKNRRFLLSIILILIISIISYILLNRMMKAEIDSLDTEIKSTQKKLDNVNKEITTLESDYEIRNTDQFKEKIAQERLGMVKDKEDDKKNEDKEDKENSKGQEAESDHPLEQEANNDNNQ